VCISGQGDRIAVYTVQYQQHLKDMAEGYTVVNMDQASLRKDIAAPSLCSSQALLKGRVM